MSPVEPYQLSKHALLRVLERTSLSPGQVLDRLNTNGVAWLPAKLPLQHRHALLYCAVQHTYIVAVVHEPSRLVKTLLAQEQWETTYWKLEDVWLSLARHAAASSLQGGHVAPGSTDALEDAASTTMDVRLVAKADTTKGPKYQTLLVRTEAQWTAVLGSVPAPRRYVQDGFLSKLADKLLTVNAFADLVRRRLERHAGVVACADNLLLVFGPAAYPVPLLPQVDIGKGLCDVVERVAQTEQKRQREKQARQQRRQDFQQERVDQATSVMPATNRELLALLTRQRSGNTST